MPARKKNRKQDVCGFFYTYQPDDRREEGCPSPFERLQRGVCDRSDRRERREQTLPLLLLQWGKPPRRGGGTMKFPLFPAEADKAIMFERRWVGFFRLASPRSF
jgi:hypothetical protein